MSHIIVDGYNVIHAWDDLGPLLRGGQAEDARSRLIAILDVHAAETGDKITVVFDSRRGPKEAQMEGHVEVIYAADRSSADHLIERLAFGAKESGETSQMQVVTKDRLHADMVRAMGVLVISPAEFRSVINRSAQGSSDKRDTLHRQAGDSRRLQERISPEDREKLERIWRGES